MDDSKLNERKALDDADEFGAATEDFKAAAIEAQEALEAQIAFWREWIPGGFRRRHRYRTKGHGARRLSRRKRNKVARIARRADRRAKRRKR